MNSENAADQIEAMRYVTNSQLMKYTRMIDTIMAPDFVNNTAYPLEWGDSATNQPYRLD